MSREAMQLALELIEPIAHNSTDDPRGKAYEAITALRQALEQQPAVPASMTDMVDAAMVEMKNIYPPLRRSECQRLISAALSSAPEQPADEPVAWIHNFIEGGISIGKKPTNLNRHPDRWTALYKDPTPCKTCQALAMAVMNDQTYHEKIIPKRQWVGLTAYEIQEIYSGNQHWGNFASAIEAKLKEKNT